MLPTRLGAFCNLLLFSLPPEGLGRRTPGNHRQHMQRNQTSKRTNHPFPFKNLNIANAESPNGRCQSHRRKNSHTPNIRHKTLTANSFRQPLGFGRIMSRIAGICVDNQASKPGCNQVCCRKTTSNVPLRVDNHQGHTGRGRPTLAIGNRVGEIVIAFPEAAPHVAQCPVWKDGDVAITAIRD